MRDGDGAEADADRGGGQVDLGIGMLGTVKLSMATLALNSGRIAGMSMAGITTEPSPPVRVRSRNGVWGSTAGR